MATYVKQKYGTLVLTGLIAFGAFWYTGNDRLQIMARDYVEIAEGVRERQVIATAVSGTNSFNILIATNKAQMEALDDVIIGLITNFVDQTQISAWAASGSTNPPPHWTPLSLLSALSIAPNGVFPPYEIQTKKADLVNRADVLEMLIYTDSPSAWARAEKCERSGGAGNGVVYTETNFSTGAMSAPVVTNQALADAWWSNLEMQDKEDGLSWWENPLTAELTVTALAPTNFYYAGNAYLHPYYSWTLSGSCFASIVEDAAYWGSIGQNYWRMMFRKWRNTSGSWSSLLRKTRLTASGRSIPVLRQDYFYDETSLLEVVSVSSNTTTVTTSLYVLPKDIEWGERSVSCVAVQKSGVAWETFYPSSYYVQLDKTSTNTAVLISATYTSPQIYPRYVIHKWDVTRCVPE